jgi:uroporphyrinogen decarboxylase
MTSRERVACALEHREPDRVPIDCGATMCSSLTRGASNNVKDYLHIEEPEDRVTCVLNDSVALSDKLLDLFEVDFRTVRMNGPSEESDMYDVRRTGVDLCHHPSDGSIYDEFGTVWRRSSFDYVPVCFSLEHATAADLREFPWPDPYSPGRVEGVREEAKRLSHETDYAVVSDFICGGPFEQAQRIRGFERFMLDLAIDQRFAVYLLEFLTDNAMGFWDAMLSEVGDLVDVVCQGDDLGMQTGLQISPEMYRRFIKPCHQRLFSFIHEKSGAKLWLHSCGSIYDIIPDLIEVGVDALNPVQTSAKNMELWRLKRDFGTEITFWGGGIEIQRLPSMSNEDIRKTVTASLETMAPGGGYVFAASHNILPDTTGEQIYTAFMTAVENR